MSATRRPRCPSSSLPGDDLVRREHEIEELLADPMVVAVGETGLDAYRMLSPMEDQHRAFRVLGKPARQAHAPQLIGPAPAGSGHGRYFRFRARLPYRAAQVYFFSSSPSHRNAAADVLSLEAPARATARCASSRSFSRSGTPAAVSSPAISVSFRPLHMPSVHTISTSLGSIGRRRCRVWGLCFEVLFTPDVLYCLTYFHVLEHTHVSPICPGD